MTSLKTIIVGTAVDNENNFAGIRIHMKYSCCVIDGSVGKCETINSCTWTWCTYNGCE